MRAHGEEAGKSSLGAVSSARAASSSVQGDPMAPDDWRHLSRFNLTFTCARREASFAAGWHGDKLSYDTWGVLLAMLVGVAALHRLDVDYRAWREGGYVVFSFLSRLLPLLALAVLRGRRDAYSRWRPLIMTAVHLGRMVVQLLAYKMLGVRSCGTMQAELLDQLLFGPFTAWFFYVVPFSSFLALQTTNAALSAVRIAARRGGTCAALAAAMAGRAAPADAGTCAHTANFWVGFTNHAAAVLEAFGVPGSADERVAAGAAVGGAGGGGSGAPLARVYGSCTAAALVLLAAAMMMSGAVLYIMELRARVTYLQRVARVPRNQVPNYNLAELQAILGVAPAAVGLLMLWRLLLPLLWSMETLA